MLKKESFEEAGEEILIDVLVDYELLNLL